MTDSAQGARPARSRAHLARDIALAVMIAAAGPAAVKFGPDLAHHIGLRRAGGGGASHDIRADPAQAALRKRLGPPESGDLAAIYAARDYRPIWTANGRAGPEALRLVAMLTAADREGLDPRRYGAADLQNLVARLKPSAPADAARADVALSNAYADYVVDLHRPVRGAEMIVTDPAAAAGPASRRDALAGLARAPHVGAWLDAATRMNPLYEQYRTALADWRASHSGGSGRDEAEVLLRANLERTRALPADPGRRYILVDVAAQQLSLYEDGRVRDTMRVVVGKPSLKTPMMSGVIRYAVFNPYWNVPPDLTRDRFAPRVVADPGVVAAEHMEVLSDWREGAQTLDPQAVDWSAVAGGRQTVWLRQRPGPDNMMGQVKFMLPNNLGIYLHDTPNKAAFNRGQRALSAGCVRVQDARRLATWLFEGRAPSARATAEQRVDLASPVPVYMTYLTVAPQAGGGLQRRPDIYRRDPALLAQLGPDLARG